VGRACSTNRKKWNTFRILVGKSEGKRPLGRTKTIFKRQIYKFACGVKMEAKYFSETSVNSHETKRCYNGS
jgi:hypothetical protein